MSVTVTISTKDRYYTTLPLVLSAVINQTVTPDKILLFDDGLHLNLKKEPLYQDLFALMHQKQIRSYVVFGKRVGQVANHQHALDTVITDYIWRLDDDTVPESNVLENLLKHININDKIGAVAGLVLPTTGGNKCPSYVTNNISDIHMGLNMQWFRHNSPEPISVQHLYSSFLFRKEAGRHGYCPFLSPVGHREETIFTHEMFRNGWGLSVLPTITTWHLRNPEGGIRSYRDKGMWAHDENIFSKKLAEWGVTPNKYRIIVLDNGIGDHYAFKHIIKEVIDKYHDHQIILAVCNKEVFDDIDGVNIVSIADIKLMLSDITKHNIYTWMAEHNWSGNIIEAMRRMYL